MNIIYNYVFMYFAMVLQRWLYSQVIYGYIIYFTGGRVFAILMLWHISKLHYCISYSIVRTVS